MEGLVGDRGDDDFETGGKEFFALGPNESPNLAPTIKDEGFSQREYRLVHELRSYDLAPVRQVSAKGKPMGRYSI